VSYQYVWISISSRDKQYISSNMSGRSDRKKRKIDDQGGTLGGGEDGRSTEEITLTKTMTEIINQNRDMLQMMKSMQEKQDRIETSMQGIEVRQGKMERSMQTMHKKQNTNTMKLLDVKSVLGTVDEKQKYHEILLKNQKWEYSANRPSADYWNSLGEDDFDEAEDLLKQMKEYTEEMRYSISIGGGEREEDIEIDLDAVLPYNKEFLPHWKEFADALELYQYYLKFLPKDNRKKKLRLSDVELSDEVVDLLSKALKSTHFKHVFLRNNNFGDKGIGFALEYLKGNKECKEFDIRGNVMGMKDIKELCDIIPLHPSLEYLKVMNCVGDDVDGFQILKSIINIGESKLDSINLSNNRISTGGDTFIADIIKSNKHSWRSLKLNKNLLDDNDVVAIAEALKHNTKLRLLQIDDNNIAKTGWKALRKVEFDNTSLNAAANSNHKCGIKYPPDGSDVIEGMDISDMNGDGYRAFIPSLVRQKKIYSVLSSRNRDCSNVTHFEDVPVELLPDMLKGFEYYSNYHGRHPQISPAICHAQPLSIVYEICRNWDKSLAVFEALSS